MNKLGSSYDHRKKLRLLKLSLDPTKSTKILRGSHEVLTKLLRLPYGRLTKRVSYEVQKNLGQDHRPDYELTSGVRMFYERWFRTAFLRRSYEMVKKSFVRRS